MAIIQVIGREKPDLRQVAVATEGRRKDISEGTMMSLGK